MRVPPGRDDNPAEARLNVTVHVRDLPAFLKVIQAAIDVLQASEQDGVVYAGDERLAQLHRAIELLSPEMREDE